MKKEDLFIFFLLGPLLLLSFVFNSNYILYIATPAYAFIYLLFCWIKKYPVEVDRQVVLAMLLHFTLISVSGLVNFFDLNYFAFFRDTIILLLPYLIFIFRVKFKNYHVRYLFLMMVLCYLIHIDFNLSFRLIGNLLLGDQLNSNEFIAGFIFGLFLVHFIRVKDFWFILLAIIFSVLTGKRVTYFGLFLAVAAYYFIFKPLASSKEGSNTNVIILFSYYFSLFLVGIFLVEITEFFLKITELDMEMTAWNLLAARDEFIYVLKTKWVSSDFLNLIFGFGSGQADATLQSSLNPYYHATMNLGSPHNDFMKILFDYGLAGFFGFFIILKGVFSKKNTYLIIFYVLAVFLLDNSLIVLYNMLLGGVIARVENR